MTQSSFMIEALKVMLKETCEGPSAEGSYFTTTDPQAGLFGTLCSLTSEQVSQPVVTSDVPLAAHVNHVRYYLKVSNSDFSDSPMDYDDKESWKVRSVDEQAWEKLKADLKQEYETFINRIEAETEWTEDKATYATATLAHTAYHLGALRQMIKLL